MGVKKSNSNSKGARKGKKAISTDDVDDFNEQATKDAVSDGPLHSVPSDSLDKSFDVVQVVPSSTSKKKRKKSDKQVNKADMATDASAEASNEDGSKKECGILDVWSNEDNKEAIDRVDLGENEPTMAEKLASLDFSNNETTEVEEKLVPRPAQPPSADSVHVLLKQAIHADDRSLLLDCLYNQDQKVISNSVSLLSSSDTFKLLNSLLSIVQSRGAVVACALPWLRSLLLQHASKIMSQESSLAALNSLYQMIDSRVSTFSAAVQLASSLDSLYAGAAGDVTDEDEPVAPVIYNDDIDGDSEDDESEDAMETDEEYAEEVEGSSNVSDVEGSMQMSDLEE